MKAYELYKKLKNDFIIDGIEDVDWASIMPHLDRCLTTSFKQNGGIGLMCDFTSDIEKVYTTVFLSDKVLSWILNENISNAMLFSHHPTRWDLKNNNGNYAPNEDYIAKLKERNIAVYILHHPLDNYSKYSTCGTLANELKINILKPAFLYMGAYCGVIGTTECKSIDELSHCYTQTVGHKTSVYAYGNGNVQGEKVAVCPGGGNAMLVINEMIENNIKTLITGVTIVNDYSQETHIFEKENKINVLGGTHYSSEKFAPIEMCKYFNNLGLQSNFIDDSPDLFDL